MYIVEEDTLDQIAAKIGITDQNPSDRLRLLQQGNPRKLVFKYMWVGVSKHVKRLESTIKQTKVGGIEWRKMDPEKLRKFVLDLISEQQSDIHEITDNVPYHYRSYGKCPWYQNNVSIYDVYRTYSKKETPNLELVYKGEELVNYAAFNAMFTAT